MGQAKFEKFKSTKDSQYYFHLKAGNGEITLASEGYVSEQGCDNGISSVKTNCSSDSNYERKSNLGSFTFNLKAGNGEIIGRSESYTTSQARDKGIESVKQDGPSAPIIDLT